MISISAGKNLNSNPYIDHVLFFSCFIHVYHFCGVRQPLKWLNTWEPPLKIYIYTSKNKHVPDSKLMLHVHLIVANSCFSQMMIRNCDFLENSLPGRVCPHSQWLAKRSLHVSACKIWSLEKSSRWLRAFHYTPSNQVPGSSKVVVSSHSRGRGLSPRGVKTLALEKSEKRIYVGRIPKSVK